MAPVIFITGAPGVGKTTVARRLADRFERAYFVDLDYFRSNVVKGLSQPSAGWSDETTLQFSLAHIAAGKVAAVYSEGGFAVIIAHCSNLDSIREFLNECPSAIAVCLHASLDTNLERNRTRTNKSFDPVDIEFFVRDMAETMKDKFADEGFPTLDTTELSINESVDRILSLIS